MKKVNLISSLSPHKQYEIRRWFWCTVLLWGLSIMIGMYYIVPQIWNCCALKKEVSALRAKTDDYQECCKKRDACLSESALLSAQSIKIDGYKNKAKNPHQYITEIRQAAENGITFESLKFDKKNIECVIMCSSPEHATVFMKRLSVSDLFTGIKLVSLHRDGQSNRFKVVIKGMIVQ